MMNRKATTIAGLLGMGVLLLGLAVSASNVRGPISILGNAGFTEENGVVAGSGTADDPYIIAGWEIEVPEDGYYGVRVENVSARFEIRALIIRFAYELNGAGIRIGFAEGGLIRGCIINDSMNGIDIVSSTDIRVEQTIMLTSGRGLRVVGESMEQYRHQIADSNMHNGRPIHYYYGVDGETISGLETGHLTVAGSRNVTVSNNDLINGDGLLLAFVEESTVKHNRVRRVSNVITEHGIHLVRSNHNEVYENTVSNNRLAGIQLTLSHHNNLHDNFSLVNDSGIRLVGSTENTLSGNELYRNVTGLALLAGANYNIAYGNVIYDDGDRSAEGIVLEAARDNRVEENLIYRGEMGIIIEASASNNVILANTVVSGAYGLAIAGSDNTVERNLLSQHERGILFVETFTRTVTRGNTFLGNVLADNGDHLYTNMDSRGNRFSGNAFLNRGLAQVSDRGEGNVWTLDGVGNYWGFGAVEDHDGDGIGDTPIRITPAAEEDTAPMASVDALALGLGVVGTLAQDTVSIRTANGTVVSVPVLVADSPHARFTGFRGFPLELIEGFPGLLFVFEEEVDAGFVMDTVLFDLDIAFFTEAGEWAGGTTMTAMTRDLYKAGAPFMYALELLGGSFEELGIGVGSQLVIP